MVGWIQNALGLSSKQQIICPYCLVGIRTRGQPNVCPKCDNELPVQYVNQYGEHPPFFMQVFGWSRAGKTVYQSALTLMLMGMVKVWSDYVSNAVTDPTRQRMEEINQYTRHGVMPPMTQMGEQEIYMMLLNNMERWGGRTLVLRDCAGEIFDTMEVPTEQAPFLLSAPTTFMFISLPDIANSGGRTMDLLLNNYINTLMTHGFNFSKESRQLVVVLTKADIMTDLPPNLRNYLINDPLWASINVRGYTKQMDAAAMQEYMETLKRVSDAIQDWIKQDAAGLAFVRMAHRNNIDLRFSIISSTGSDVGEDGNMQENLSPRRVLDPFFWALELQSQP